MSLPPASAPGPEKPHLPEPGYTEEIKDLDVTPALDVARPLGFEALRQATLVAVGAPELRAFKLTSEAMILAARQLQARAYTDHGYVTEQGLNDDDTLIEVLDPIDLVRQNSTYVGTMSPTEKLIGAIRLVEKADFLTLPTLAKLVEARSPDDPIFSTLAFMKGAKVFEASALGRLSDGEFRSDRTVMSRLLLAMRSEGARRGFEYCVIGAVPETARLLRLAYGSQAFQRIGGKTTIIHLKDEGLRKGGITLEPYYVELDKFIEQCLEYFNRRPNHRHSVMNIPLFEAAQKFTKEQRQMGQDG